MKKIITGILMVLALLFGGVGLSAPAQAEVEPMRTGSSVWFNHIDGSIPKTIDFHVVKVSGTFFYLSWQETLSNVERVCPKSDEYRLSYRNPEGTQRLLPAGDCLFPGLQGLYEVGYQRA